MKIAIGSDHRGFEAKRRLVATLQEKGHEVIDLGPQSSDSVDYTGFEAERGILICGTGLGMAIAANKVRGVRAVPCQDAITAEMSRRHNDANVLCLSADLLGEDLMDQMVRIWLDTPFEAGRHARRVEKIAKIESEQYGAGQGEK